MNTEKKDSSASSNSTATNPGTITQPYEPPRVTSYTSEEILEQAGPAQACSPSPCGIF